jgi:hypothetical protein
VQEIAKQASETKHRVACVAVKVVMVAILAAQLSGCMSLGLGLTGDDVDANLTTSSIPSSKPTETVSDQVTIRNAATSVDLKKLNGQPLPWANSDTGSAGVITSIEESRGDQLVCRDFTTTSHSFKGVAKYHGKACLTGQGEWQLIRFEKFV